MAELIHFLGSNQLREKIKNEVSEEQEDWDNLVVSTGWNNVVVSSALNNPQYEGKSILEISAITGKESIDTAIDLLLQEEGNDSIVYYHMSSKDVESIIKWDYSLIISDSLGCEVGTPHPRTYGSFPRLFSKYVNETKTLTLEQAVRM